MSLGNALAVAKKDAASVRVVTARFVEQDGAQALVEFDGSGDQIPMSNGSGTWPRRGDAVYCVFLNGSWLMLGAASVRASRGRVMTVTGDRATVEFPEGSGHVESFLVPTGATVNPGALAVLDHEGGGLIVAAYGGEPASNDPEDAPVKKPDDPGAKPRKTAEFPAVWSGNVTQAGYWMPDTNRLYLRNFSGTWNYAAFGYGNRVRSVIPAGSSILKAEIWLGLDSGSAPIRAGVHTLNSRSGTPSPDGAHTVTPSNGWNQLDSGALSSLMAGQDHRGVVFWETGNFGVILKGTGQGAGFGKLRITYQ